jgi:phage terminase Nu1 subunit (DNA packaging protein)
MSKTTAPKRGRGRPRNAALDALEKELAVSRRHASSLLKELKNAGAGTSENSGKSVSPLAEARLEKVLKECRLLETKIRTAELEQRRAEGELLHADDALDLLRAVLCPIADGLKRLPKWMGPRLVGQSLGEIEAHLTEEINRLLRLGDTSLKAALEKVGKRKL